MKKYLFSIIFLLVSYVGFSQKGLSYQAVILDPTAIEVPGQDITGQPLVNGDVWMKFSIYNGSTLQFEEVQKTKTDGYGLVNLMIGSVSTASFNSLTWDGVQKSLQVFVSFNQGASYTKVSDQKLNYTPYALYAETAGKLGSVLSIAGGGTGATTAADARVNLGLGNVDNTSDAAKPISTATNAALDLKANSTVVNAALALKANTSDMTAALAAKADTGTIKTFVVTQVAAATIADADASTKGKIQLAGDLAGTSDAPTVPGLALKANSSDVTIALDLKANATDVTSALALKANANNVVTSLNLKENISNKSTNISLDGASDTKYPSVKAVKSYVNAQVIGGVGSVTISDADANTKGKIKLSGDLAGTADSPTVPSLAWKANAADLVTLTSIVTANTASITANSTAITTEATTARAAELVLTNNVAANTASITLDIAAIELKAPIASPTFIGTLTAPIFATTPQILTSGSTINWNPTQGLNASVTLDQNSILSFSTTPPSGSYGTLVVTQDAIGNRTITLPTTSNKVLGSASTTTIALSSAANAKDILNFYYDGTNCYWNIGQGYGTAAPATITNLGIAVTGTLPVTNGGTGATTLSGLVKGNGTNALTAAVAGTDYLAPNGSAASLTNFPTLNQNTSGNASTATLATTATNVSGIVAIANGGTGSANQNFVDITTAQAVAGTKSFSSSVAVGTAAAPVSSAVMEVASTTKGFLPPRMTAAQRDAISAPATGLVLWCTNCSINGELQVYNGSSWTNAVGGATQAAFSVGTPYGGGIVAYILQPVDPGYDPAVLHGLIATVANLSTSARWTSGEIAFSGAVASAIGTGNQNTIDIVAGDPTAGLAARLCSDLVQGGYSDWYLPSKDELSKLALNRAAIGGFTQNWYWSSTKQPENEPQFPGKYAWYVSFYNSEAGTINNHFTTTTNAVRAVRSF